MISRPSLCNLCVLCVLCVLCGDFSAPYTKHHRATEIAQRNRHYLFAGVVFRDIFLSWMRSLVRKQFLYGFDAAVDSLLPERTVGLQ